MVFTFILTFLSAGSIISAADVDFEEHTFQALSFGKTTVDYIHFTPGDMSPFQTSFTGCAWVKRLHDASSPILLHYHSATDQIVMGSNGSWNRVQGTANIDLRGKFPGKNQWFHYCMSWSSGGELIVYVDGEKIGSKTASTENLNMEGKLSVGQAVRGSQSSGYTFGGQLLKLNLFSEVLSPTEIRDMRKAGMCSSIEMKYESRKLTWERILSRPRYGNVTEFIPEECYKRTIGYFKEKLNKTEILLEKTEEKLLDRETKLNQTENKLEEFKTTLNTTVFTLEKTKTHLSEAQDEIKKRGKALNETQTELTATKNQLQEVKSAWRKTEIKLNETLSKLEVARKIEDVSRWDVLFTPPYLNKLFTRKLYNQLVGNWNMMGKYLNLLIIFHLNLVAASICKSALV